MASRLLGQIIRPPEDLTKGNILRNVVILSLPVALTQSSTVLFQLVDTMFIGRLSYSTEALAAVTAAGHTMFLIITMLIGLTIGTTAMVARFIGEREPDKAAVAVFNSFLLCLALSLVLALVGIWFSEPILRVVGAQGRVLELAVQYFRVLMVASVAMIMLFLIGSILQGAGDAITPLMLFAGANVVNLVLDPFFIYDWFEIPSLNLWLVRLPAVHLTGLDLGVRGAALATVIGRGVFCLVGVIVLRRGLSRVHVQPKHFSLNLQAMWQLIVIGVPSALQMMIRATSGVILIRIVSGFGDAAMAGLGLGWRMVMLALMPGFGIGRASGALAGQNLGARKPERAVRSVWTSVAIYGVFMAGCTVVGVLFASFFMRQFTSDHEVIITGAVYLRYAASVYCFIGLAIILSKSMEGAGYTLVPMFLTFVALFGVMIPLALVLPKALGIGIHGVWIAMVVAYTLHAAGALVVFQLGRWKEKRIELDYRELAIPPQESVAAPE